MDYPIEQVKEAIKKINNRSATKETPNKMFDI